MCKEYKILMDNFSNESIDSLQNSIGLNYKINFLASQGSLVSEIDSYKPDIVFMDADRTKENALDICSRISQGGENPAPKVVMSSSIHDPGFKSNGYRAGAFDFLMKPHCVEEISAKLLLYLNLIKHQSDEPFDVVPKTSHSAKEALKLSQYVNKILFIKSQAPYCGIYYQNPVSDKPIDVTKLRISLNFIEKFYKRNSLLRVHRSYIISSKKVIGIRKRRCHDFEVLVGIQRKGAILIPVGRSYVDNLKRSTAKPVLL